MSSLHRFVVRVAVVDNAQGVLSNETRKCLIKEHDTKPKDIL